MPLVRREDPCRALGDHHQSAARVRNVLPWRRPSSGERRRGCPGSTCRSPPARTNGSCTRPRTIRRRRARPVPRCTRVGRHHHGRAAPDPVPTLHEDQPAAFGPTFRRAEHTPRLPAILRLGDAARPVWGRTRAMRRHDEVLVVRRIQRHVVDETILRVTFVLGARQDVRPAVSAVRRLPQALRPVPRHRVEHTAVDGIGLHAPLRAVSDAAVGLVVAHAAGPGVHPRPGRAAVVRSPDLVVLAPRSKPHRAGIERIDDDGCADGPVHGGLRRRSWRGDVLPRSRSRELSHVPTGWDDLPPEQPPSRPPRTRPRVVGSRWRITTLHRDHDDGASAERRSSRGSGGVSTGERRTRGTAGW